MKKRLLIFFVTVLVSFIAIYFSHFYLMIDKFAENDILFKMYIFHFISSLLVYGGVEFVFSHLPDQAGFAFLASVLIKIGFFVLIFSGYIYKDVPLEMYEKTSIVIPFFTFLLIEAIFSFNLLNKS